MHVHQFDRLLLPDRETWSQAVVVLPVKKARKTPGSANAGVGTAANEIAASLRSAALGGSRRAPGHAGKGFTGVSPELALNDRRRDASALHNRRPEAYFGAACRNRTDDLFIIV